jgi:hypothetical protein
MIMRLAGGAIRLLAALEAVTDAADGGGDGGAGLLELGAEAGQMGLEPLRVGVGFAGPARGEQRGM